MKHCATVGYIEALIQIWATVRHEVIIALKMQAVQVDGCVEIREYGVLPCRYRRKLQVTDRNRTKCAPWSRSSESASDKMKYTSILGRKQLM